MAPYNAAMPIFEYTCSDCGSTFELIIQGSGVPECPACHSKKLDKQLSVFAVGRSRGEVPTMGCATCGHPDGPGACSRRD